MIFTEEWLRQYVNPALSTDELAEALTMAGLEVEEVTTAAPAFTGVVVAEVLTCRDHENSDHLHVCEVNAGTGETLQIVCGAPNVRAGIKVACATIGAVLPGDFKIKKSKLRGVVSMGMLCSARELGISVPNDLKVTGFDGTELVSTYHPELSTVVQPLEDIASVLINLLLERIKNPDEELKQMEYVLPVTFKRSTSIGQIFGQ